MRPFFGTLPKFRRPSRRTLLIALGVKLAQSGAVYLIYNIL